MFSKIFPRYRRASMLTTVILLAIAVGVVVLSQAYQPAVRAFPLLIAWLMIGLCLLELVSQTDTAPGRAVHGFFSGGVGQETNEEVTLASALTVLGAIAWVLMFAVSVFAVGFMVTIPIYMFVSMYLLGHNSLARSLITAALITATVWLFFEYALGYKLFRGVLAPLFMGYLGLE